MGCFRKFRTYLREYCENCTIAGLCYIANKRLHFIERLFWLICVVLSAGCAWYLINLYRINFAKTDSIVFETETSTTVDFLSVSVCNTFRKSVSSRIEEYIKNNCEVNCDDYDYDREHQLLMFVYPHMYHDGSMKVTCDKMKGCATCNDCFKQEERVFLEEFPFDCEEMFVKCSAAGEIFDCCQYFLPYITPYGKCFLLNSLQNNHRDSKHWFNKTFFPGNEEVEITISVRQPMHVTVLNYEDLPNLVMPLTSISIAGEGKRKILQVYVEKMVNDPDIVHVLPEYRKCLFPEEALPTSLYKAHSFTACLNDCIRLHQRRLCNCSMQALVPKANKEYPPCGLEGIYCLEKYSLIKPDAKMLLPWSDSGITCNCMPSCSEYFIESVYESSQVNIGGDYSEIKVCIPHQATFNFRRRALRSYVDIIVTIGGILGLLLGASILSGAEILQAIMFWICSINFGKTKKQQTTIAQKK